MLRWPEASLGVSRRILSPREVVTNGDGERFSHGVRIRVGFSTARSRCVFTPRPEPISWPCDGAYQDESAAPLGDAEAART